MTVLKMINEFNSLLNKDRAEFERNKVNKAIDVDKIEEAAMLEALEVSKTAPKSFIKLLEFYKYGYGEGLGKWVEVKKNINFYKKATSILSWLLGFSVIYYILGISIIGLEGGTIIKAAAIFPFIIMRGYSLLKENECLLKEIRQEKCLQMASSISIINKENSLNNNEGRSLWVEAFVDIFSDRSSANNSLINHYWGEMSRYNCNRSDNNVNEEKEFHNYVKNMNLLIETLIEHYGVDVLKLKHNINSSKIDNTKAASEGNRLSIIDRVYNGVKSTYIKIMDIFLSKSLRATIKEEELNKEITGISIVVEELVRAQFNSLKNEELKKIIEPKPQKHIGHISHKKRQYLYFK